MYSPFACSHLLYEITIRRTYGAHVFFSLAVIIKWTYLQQGIEKKGYLYDWRILSTWWYKETTIRPLNYQNLWQRDITQETLSCRNLKEYFVLLVVFYGAVCPYTVHEVTPNHCTHFSYRDAPCIRFINAREEWKPRGSIFVNHGHIAYQHCLLAL